MSGEGDVRFLLAGGGTGGHVFPGIALARHAAGASISWLCTTRPFDSDQLTRAGIPFEALPSPRWQKGRGFLAPMVRALKAAARKIREFRPDVLVGVGGYGTIPPALAALAMGVPFVLLEQNVRPGKANLLLARGAKRIYVQWAEARKAFPGAGRRVVVTGSPLRPGLRPIPREQALDRFGLAPGLPTVAVVGGSQGAETLNVGIPAGVDGAARGLQIIHVTGPSRTEPVAAAYRERGAKAVVLDFVHDMEALYSAADLIVSRAGALAIAEIAAFGVPAVLVPLARSSGDHQRENARAVAHAGGAVMLEERACLAGGVGPILQKLVSGDGMFDNMRRNLRSLARPDAARAILKDLRTILKK